MTSVILVQHNNVHLTREAIRSFMAFHSSGYEIIVVDNASSDSDPGELLKEFPGVRLIRNSENVGFGRANNQAARVAAGEILLFLNNDTLTIADVLSQVVREFSEDRNIGVIGPKLLNRDGSFQLSSGVLPSFWREIIDKILYTMVNRGFQPIRAYAARVYGRERIAGWVTGAALFIQRELFEKVGGFDERMFMYFEDKDLCLRVALAGGTVKYVPGVAFQHVKAGTSSDNPGFADTVYRQSQLHYYAMHRPWIEHEMLKAYLRLTGKSPS